MNDVAASRESSTSRHAFRIFLVVAALCVIQVGWWLACQVHQAERRAELEKAELDLRSLEITVGVGTEVSKLWDQIDEMVKDTGWTGGVPRLLNENSLVYNINRRPAVTRRIQSPFGSYDLANWTWAFYGPKDSLWVTLDPDAIAHLVVLKDSGFEYRGEAPLPGEAPFVLDPPPVRPTTAKLEEVDRERRTDLIWVCVEAGAFLLLVLALTYLLYRTAVRTA